MYNNYIEHSAEGSHWTKQNHKYIRKEGNRYIYPEDLKKGNKKSPWAEAIKNQRKAKSDQLKKDFSNMYLKPIKNNNPIAKYKSSKEKAEAANKRMDAEARLNARQKYFNTKKTLSKLDTENNKARVNTALDRNAQRKALIDQAYHKKAVNELHDNRGFKKNPSQYYDDKGVRKTERPKYDTAYDERGVRKNHSTLTYDIPKKEEKKNFFERKKEEHEKASAERKWTKEKKSIKRQNEKEFNKRRRNRRKAAGKAAVKTVLDKLNPNKKSEPKVTTEPAAKVTWTDSQGRKHIEQNETYVWDKKQKKYRKVIKEVGKGISPVAIYKVSD